MMRWGHGHSTVLGIVIGVAVLGGHILWALTVALALGVLVGRFWSALSQLLRRLAQGRTPQRFTVEDPFERWRRTGSFWGPGRAVRDVPLRRK